MFMYYGQWKAALFRSNIRILHLTNRSSRLIRQKFMGPFYNGEEIQQSNGKLDFSVRNKVFQLINRSNRSNCYDPFSNELYFTVLDNTQNEKGRRLIDIYFTQIWENLRVGPIRIENFAIYKGWFSPPHKHKHKLTYADVVRC